MAVSITDIFRDVVEKDVFQKQMDQKVSRGITQSVLCLEFR